MSSNSNVSILIYKYLYLKCWKESNVMKLMWFVLFCYIVGAQCLHLEVISLHLSLLKFAFRYKLDTDNFFLLALKIWYFFVWYRIYLLLILFCLTWLIYRDGRYYRISYLKVSSSVFHSSIDFSLVSCLVCTLQAPFFHGINYLNWLTLFIHLIE